MREDAWRWATHAELAIDRGEAPKASRIIKKRTLTDLIDLYLDDLLDVGKPVGRTKAASLKAMKRDLGATAFTSLDKLRIVNYGRSRAKAGAGPVTLSMDIGLIKLVLEHASAVHDIDVKLEPIEKARLTLKHLGLVGGSNERDRRPTDEELDQLFLHFDDNPRQTIPMKRIIQFAIATAMRQDEICRVTWSDFDPRGKTLMIRDRKDPRQKYGNDQRIPLVDLTGFDPIQLIEDQRPFRSNFDDRIFPYNGKSAGAAFARATTELKIEDLVFHDTRHEGTSRLFEAGLDLPQVALITGHKDWKMLARYTHIKPSAVHAAAARLKKPFPTEPAGPSLDSLGLDRPQRLRG